MQIRCVHRRRGIRCAGLRSESEVLGTTKMGNLAKRSIMHAMRLGGFCLSIAASAFAQQAINAPPDTIFYNGKIITVDSGFTIRQAFAVRGDLYVAVGTSARIRALAGKNTRIVDLKGAAVIPGLSDNHDHLYNSEKVMRGIDLVGVTSTEEVLKRLRDGLAKAKPGETVFGSIGWRAPLTKKDLDQVSTDVPIVALRGRRGAALLNTAALKKAGIVKEMQSYMGKLVPKDNSGELTGELPDWPADDGILGLRHKPIALLPRHRCETAAFLPADQVEDDLGELASGRTAACLRPNSGGRRLGSIGDLRSFRCLGSFGRSLGRMLDADIRPTNLFCFLSHLVFPPMERGLT